MNKSITQQIDEQQKRCRWCGKPVSIFHMFCNDKCRKDYDSQKEYFKKKGLCYECGLPVTQKNGETYPQNGNHMHFKCGELLEKKTNLILQRINFISTQPPFEKTEKETITKISEDLEDDGK